MPPNCIKSVRRERKNHNIMELQIWILCSGSVWCRAFGLPNLSIETIYILFDSSPSFWLLSIPFPSSPFVHLLDVCYKFVECWNKMFSYVFLFFWVLLILFCFFMFHSHIFSLCHVPRGHWALPPEWSSVGLVHPPRWSAHCDASPWTQRTRDGPATGPTGLLHKPLWCVRCVKAMSGGIWMWTSGEHRITYI